MALARLSLSNDPVSTVVSVSTAVLGCLTASGLFTRAAAAAGIVVMAVCDRGGIGALMPLVAEAVSLVLVGAGSYSLDAMIGHKRFAEWRYRP